jgi:hypothetical protein
VVEIIRYRQAFGHADLSEMARRHHLPSAVLEPTFAELGGQGMVTRSADTLDLTAAGESEVERVVGSFRAWLVDQLADWDWDPTHPPEQEIGAALQDISRRLLQHHDEHRVPPALAAA